MYKINFHAIGLQITPCSVKWRWVQWLSVTDVLNKQFVSNGLYKQPHRHLVTLIGNASLNVEVTLAAALVQGIADLVYVIGDINIHSGILHIYKVYKQMHISHTHTHTHTHTFTYPHKRHSVYKERNATVFYKIILTQKQMLKWYLRSHAE